MRVNNFNGFQRKVERVSQAVVRVGISENGQSFESVRALLLQWLREKAGRDLTPTMISGGTDTLDLLGAQRVETTALEEPKLWAARQDFQDDRVPGRTWVTEAMLASADYRALLLGFRLHCITLGEPASFSRSIPRFMRTVAQRHHVALDGIETDLHAQPVETRDETDALVKLLVDPRRRAPIVGISTVDTYGKEDALIRADHLASAVFGTAHVRVLSRQASFQLTDKIGKSFSVFNGALRVWWPNSRLIKMTLMTIRSGWPKRSRKILRQQPVPLLIGFSKHQQGNAMPTTRYLLLPKRGGPFQLSRVRLQSTTGVQQMN